MTDSGSCIDVSNIGGALKLTPILAPGNAIENRANGLFAQAAVGPSVILDAVANQALPSGTTGITVTWAGASFSAGMEFKQGVTNGDRLQAPEPGWYRVDASAVVSAIPLAEAGLYDARWVSGSLTATYQTNMRSSDFPASTSSRVMLQASGLVRVDAGKAPASIIRAAGGVDTVYALRVWQASGSSAKLVSAQYAVTYLRPL